MKNIKYLFVFSGKQTRLNDPPQFVRTPHQEVGGAVEEIRHAQNIGELRLGELVFPFANRGITDADRLCERHER